MAKNGISTLPTKEDRQIAKLEAAQTKRQQSGAAFRNLRYYDTALLPTVYQGNAVVNQPNVGGLVAGRPWKSTPNILSGLWRTHYNDYFDGDWTWFDAHTPASTGEVTNFSVDDIMSEYISVQWLGYFKAPHTANYNFYLYSDDKSIFWLGDKAITGYDNGNWDVYCNGDGETMTDPISLVAGQYYPIRVQYGNGPGPGFFIFSWSDDYAVFPTYERVEMSGPTINTEQTSAFKLTIQSSSFNTNPHVNGQIGINDLLTVDTTNRGHTILALTNTGSVIEQTSFDTWGTPSDVLAMNAKLLSYPSSTVIAVCTYDACSLSTDLRTTLNTYYGGTLTDVWDSARYSHIFIGQKV
jgi:hypothetical protein